MGQVLRAVRFYDVTQFFVSQWPAAVHYTDILTILITLKHELLPIQAIFNLRVTSFSAPFRGLLLPVPPVNNY